MGVAAGRLTMGAKHMVIVSMQRVHGWLSKLRADEEAQRRGCCDCSCSVEAPVCYAQGFAYRLLVPGVMW